MNKILFPLIAVMAVAIGFLSAEVLQKKEVNIESGTWFKQARALPEIRLVDYNHEVLTNENFKDKWTLMFFGYTHCPDICPDGLNMLNTMTKSMDKEALEQLQIVFVSVDPWRDTPAKLKEYVSYFNPKFIGASADIPELEPLTQALGIIHYITKQNEDDPSYDVAHSGAMTLINPKVQYNAVFSSPHDPVKMANDLTHIITL